MLWQQYRQHTKHPDFVQHFSDIHNQVGHMDQISYLISEVQLKNTLNITDSAFQICLSTKTSLSRGPYHRLNGILEWVFMENKGQIPFTGSSTGYIDICAT